MADDDEPIHITPEDARAGATPHVTRWVLLISMLLAIVVLGFVWSFGHS